VQVNNTPSVHSSYHTFKSGTEAANALRYDTSIATSHLAVLVDACAPHSVRKSFRNDSQYALYSQNVCRYSVSLTDYGGRLCESGLKKTSQSTPNPIFTLLGRYRRVPKFLCDVRFSYHHGCRIWGPTSDCMCVPTYVLMTID
jgi:hypothetical protein